MLIYRLLKIVISFYQTGRSYGAFHDFIGSFYKQIVPTGLPSKGILFVEKMASILCKPRRGGLLLNIYITVYSDMCT